MKLTKENKQLFFHLFFPTLLETVIIRCFNIADSIMLGQMTDSTTAVAAVGLCTSPINLISGIATSFFIGVTATISWLYGADKKKQMRTVAWQSLGIGCGIAILFCALSIIFSRNIMGFVCKDEQVLDIAASYFRMNAYGFLFQIITSNITAILRGIGITKLPMIYNVIGGVVNVVLNYLLIYGHFGFPEMRADGAALATSISKLVSLLIALGILFLKDTEVHIKYGLNKKWDKNICTKMIPIGITSACEQGLLQVGAILSAKIISTLPVSVIASNQVVGSVEGFAWSTGSATQTAITVLFGRSLGENNEKKAKAYLRLAVKYALTFAFLEMLIFIFFGKQLAGIFSNDADLYVMISIIFVLSSLTLPFINVHQTVSGALRSSGDTIAPLIASMCSLWIFRVGLGYLFIMVLDKGVYAYRLCLILDQFSRCLVVCIFYLTGHWKKHKK